MMWSYLGSVSAYVTRKCPGVWKTREDICHFDKAPATKMSTLYATVCKRRDLQANLFRSKNQSGPSPSQLDFQEAGRMNAD